MTAAFTDDGAFKGKVCKATLAEIEELDEGDCGFCRDVSSDKKGCHAGMKRLDVHVVVATDQKAKDWLSKMDGDSVAERLSATLSKAIPKEANAKVSIANFNELSDSGIEAGDVLVFFHSKVGAYHLRTPDATADAVCEVVKTGTSSAKLETRPVVMVCSHTKRDARCGYCGPVLTDLASQLSSNLLVGKINHVGGHMYAGNVLVYDAAGKDWFGYVTPSSLPAVVAKDWSPAVHQQWRGRLGHTPDQLKSLAASHVKSASMKTTACRLGALAALGAGCFYFFNRSR